MHNYAFIEISLNSLSEIHRSTCMIQPVLKGPVTYCIVTVLQCIWWMHTYLFISQGIYMYVYIYIYIYIYIHLCMHIIYPLYYNIYLIKCTCVYSATWCLHH